MMMTVMTAVTMVAVGIPIRCVAIARAVINRGRWPPEGGRADGDLRKDDRRGRDSNHGRHRDGPSSPAL